MITRRAIQNNRVTAVILLSLFFAGLGAYASLPRALDPGFLIRAAQIMTIFPGASPERVEQLVTDKIEKVVQELPELDFVSSTSKTGVSIVVANIQEKYTNMRPIWDKLRRKVDDVRDSLPADVIGPNVNDEFGETYGIVLTITGDGFSPAEIKEVADEVRDELLLIHEVSKVEVLGVQEERIFIEYDNARLARLGLSPGQLQGVIASRNIIIPGGQIAMGEVKKPNGVVDTSAEGAAKLSLEPTGNFESGEDLRRTVVSLPGTQQLTYLGDIVDIYRGYVDPPERQLRTNGVVSLGLAISLREGGNIITLGQKVEALLATLPPQYPHGIDFHVIAFEPTRVELKVDEFVGNVLQSVLIVLAVMLVALGLRTGLMVASLIPTTMVITLLLMQAFDIGLDQISLAALIIALGMLVDNAIVMTESILVQMRQGKAAIEAAVASARELRIPLLTSSLTTAAAFLPIYLAESAVGEYTNPLFKVVSIALLVSWGLALTMTPLLCTIFFKAETLKHGTTGLLGWIVSLIGRARRATDPDRGADAAPSDPFDTGFYRFYRYTLGLLLRCKFVTLGVAVAVFVVAMFGFRYVPQLFFPNIAEPQFTAEFRLPLGTPIERTAQMATEIEGFMRDNFMVGEERSEGIVDWTTFIGEGAPRFVLSYNPEPPSPEFAMMIVNTTSPAVNLDIMAAVRTFAFERFPDIDSKLAEQAAGPPVIYPIEVRLSGKDTGELFALVEKVKAKLRTLPGTTGIIDDWGVRTKKLVIDVNQASAFRAGVTNQDIAVSLLTNVSGLETSQYREEDRVIPITLRAKAEDREDFGRLESLAVYAQATGRNVPLKQVADTQIEFEPSKVHRRNRLRTVTVKAQLELGVTASEVNAQLIPWLDREKETWGLGYRYELGGEYETSGKANQSIGEQMPIAGFIILILLVVQFNSIRRTLIILFTIPMALIGVVFGLLVAQSYFGFMTLLGVVSLAGIVINNAIVLLERIKLEIEETGLEPREAVVEAAQRRLRPILLTTATTVGGLIPLWLGGGAMFEPMAIAILFGLLFSTLLTLGVVPTLYAILFRVSYR